MPYQQQNTTGHKIMKYYIQKFDNLYQSIFPETMANCSQLHATIDDAKEYIISIAGFVYIEVIE